MSTDAVLVVYTDGACSGNPGPGGWAWAVPHGPSASGSAAHTTNQRMEILAVLDAVTTLGARHGGPIEVVSDSTYVVHCFRDGWWKGWLARGWKNSQRQPVANRDLWEPLIRAVRERDGGTGAVRFRWVKGHGGDPFNDKVDKLAVLAAARQSPRVVDGFLDGESLPDDEPDPTPDPAAAAPAAPAVPAEGAAAAEPLRLFD